MFQFGLDTLNTQSPYVSTDCHTEQSRTRLQEQRTIFHYICGLYIFLFWVLKAKHCHIFDLIQSNFLNILLTENFL